MRPFTFHVLTSYVDDVQGRLSISQSSITLSTERSSYQYLLLVNPAISYQDVLLVTPATYENTIIGMYLRRAMYESDMVRLELHVSQFPNNNPLELEDQVCNQFDFPSAHL